MNIMMMACNYADKQTDDMRAQSNKQVRIWTQKGGRLAVIHHIVLHNGHCRNVCAKRYPSSMFSTTGIVTYAFSILSWDGQVHCCSAATKLYLG